MPRDLDLGSGYMAYRRASLIDLYLHTNFIRIGETLVDGRTYVCTTYGQTSRPALLGQLGGVDLISITTNISYSHDNVYGVRVHPVHLMNATADL